MKKVWFCLALALLLAIPGAAGTGGSGEGDPGLREVELQGWVSYITDLEGPHYDLGGVVLEADFALEDLVGKYVRVWGYPLEGPSIFMKDRVKVQAYEILEGGGEEDFSRPDPHGVSYALVDGIIVLSWGEKPTGGYGISIQDLGLKGGKLLVSYALSAPGPEDMVTTAITYPRDQAPLPEGDQTDVREVVLQRVYKEGDCPVKELPWDDPVSRRKTWTIDFQRAVDPATVNPGHIFILDQGGNRVEVLLHLREDGRSVEVFHPQGDYTPGETYELFITRGVSSRGGTPLGYCYRMTFTVEPLMPPPGEDDENTISLDYTFQDDLEGWTGDFAELPVSYDQDLYRLEFGYRDLPEELGLEGRKALYISSHNASDDIFMFIKGQVGPEDGLKPHTTYQVRFQVDIATNAPRDAVGVGGAPGESVFFKVGASPEEPRPEPDIERDYYYMNIDKGGGNQSEGENALLIGHVAKESPEFNYDYEIKTLDNLYRPLEMTTDEEGRMWLLAGTDSGFEGTTSLYYTRVQVMLTEVK